MADEPSVTRLTTLEAFVKSRTSLVIRRTGLEFLLSELNSLVGSITNWAAELAAQNERTTILLEDFEQAVEIILHRESLTIDELLAKIEELPVTDIAKLSRRVRDRAEEIRKGSS
jgi:hypothetical protein